MKYTLSTEPSGVHVIWRNGRGEVEPLYVLMPEDLEHAREILDNLNRPEIARAA